MTNDTLYANSCNDNLLFITVNFHAVKKMCCLVSESKKSLIPVMCDLTLKILLNTLFLDRTASWDSLNCIQVFCFDSSQASIQEKCSKF